MEEDEIILLWRKTTQNKVLPHEAYEFRGGSVVGDPSSSRVLRCEHGVEEPLSVTSSLYGAMYVEIEAA